MAYKQMTKWLNDAYAMEKSQLPILKNHAKDAEDNTELHAKITEHIEQTQRHAEELKACIERLGGSVSTPKTAFAKMMGAIESRATAPFKDEPMKNLEMDYAAEHFEIASYTSLIAAAEAIGDVQTAQTARKILAEEEAMANWIFTQMPGMARDYAEMAQDEEQDAGARRTQPAFGEKLNQDDTP